MGHGSSSFIEQRVHIPVRDHLELAEDPRDCYILLTKGRVATKKEEHSKAVQRNQDDSGTDLRKENAAVHAAKILGKHLNR